jgi:hypothetical protein
MSLDMPAILAAMSNKCCPSFYDSAFLDSGGPEEDSGSPDQKRAAGMISKYRCDRQIAHCCPIAFVSLNTGGAIKMPQNLSEGSHQDLQVIHSILCNTCKESKSSSGKVLIPAIIRMKNKFS